MELDNSKNINNKIKTSTIDVAIMAHLILAIITFGVSVILSTITALVTLRLLKEDIKAATSKDNSFAKNHPFSKFGQTFCGFQHIFYHPYSIDKDITSAISEALKTRTPITSVKNVSIIDTDSDLKNCEQRSFIKAESEPTSRGTSVTLLLNHSNFGSMRTVEWRVLGGGYLDNNSKFNLISYSLFSMIFWIGPYLRHGRDLLSRIRTIYPSAYNDMDIKTQVRCLHEVVFDGIITELDKNGIDSGPLKAQKMQVLNSSMVAGNLDMASDNGSLITKVASTAKAADA